MRRCEVESRRGLVTVFMRAKTGPCPPFVFVMRHMYHCHLNAASDNGEKREMDETRRRNRNQSFSAADDGRGHRARAQREKDLDIRVTRKHDTKLDRVRKNYAYLMVMFRFLVALVNFVVKCHKIALGEGAGKSVFPGLKSDTLALISSPSLSTSCLLLIAIRMT